MRVCVSSSRAGHTQRGTTLTDAAAGALRLSPSSRRSAIPLSLSLSRRAACDSTRLGNELVSSNTSIYQNPLPSSSPLSLLVDAQVDVARRDGQQEEEEGEEDGEDADHRQRVGQRVGAGALPLGRPVLLGLLVARQKLAVVAAACARVCFVESVCVLLRVCWLRIWWLSVLRR